MVGLLISDCCRCGWMQALRSSSRMLYVWAVLRLSAATTATTTTATGESPVKWYVYSAYTTSWNFYCVYFEQHITVLVNRKCSFMSKWNTFIQLLPEAFFLFKCVFSRSTTDSMVCTFASLSFALITAVILHFLQNWSNPVRSYGDCVYLSTHKLDWNRDFIDFALIRP